MIEPRHPRRRGRRPKTYAAVLEATSRLLDSTSVAELSVAQILDEADVGRTSFYEHFSSKQDVVVKLMRSIGVEVGAEMTSLFHRGDRAADEAVREGIANLMKAGAGYAPLLAAVAEEWPSNPELRAIWLAVQGEFTDRLAATIDRERAAGSAPAGADSRAVAASLVWTAERAFHVTVTGSHPRLTDPQELIEPLTQLFVGTIYGRPVTPEGVRLASPCRR